MNQAKKNKNDEFYTKLTDIEKELKYYKHLFKGKTVYCNCDNPGEDYTDINKGSNFWNYFFIQFEHLGLKKIIATYYNKDGVSYKTEYKGGGKENIIRTPLKSDGDFRSEESIELLKESDIVCTNPPFSLFREYISQLMEYEKEFLIIGNFNAVTYKEIFPLIKNNKVWLGYNSIGGMTFIQPDNTEKKINATWFTNLKVYRRKELIKLYHTYRGNEEKYPKYDNYDAIEVSKVKDIPKDYEGIMGVPITYLTKHSPKQFEILGMSKTPICHNNDASSQRIKVYDNVRQYNNSGIDVGSGNKVNDGVVLLVSEVPSQGPYYKCLGSDDIMIVKYPRIFIKNKLPKKGDAKMNEHTELERVLSCLTIDELKYLKDYLNVKDYVKEFGEVQVAKNKEDFEDAMLNSKKVSYSFLLKNDNKETPYGIFEIPEIKDCIQSGINDIGVAKMNRFIDEIIERKSDKRVY